MNILSKKNQVKNGKIITIIINKWKSQDEKLNFNCFNGFSSTKYGN